MAQCVVELASLPPFCNRGVASLAPFPVVVCVAEVSSEVSSEVALFDATAQCGAEVLVLVLSFKLALVGEIALFCNRAVPSLAGEMAPCVADATSLCLTSKAHAWTAALDGSDKASAAVDWVALVLVLVLSFKLGLAMVAPKEVTSCHHPHGR